MIQTATAFRLAKERFEEKTGHHDNATATSSVKIQVKVQPTDLYECEILNHHEGCNTHTIKIAQTVCLLADGP